MSKAKLTLLILAAGILSSFFYYNKFAKRSQIPSINNSDIQTTELIGSKEAPRLEILAENLEVPWALVFLPDQSILFTERPGRVRFIDNNGNLNPTPIAVIDDVLPTGEGGLMGIAIHPKFSQNHFAYLYYTYANSNGQTLNRVVRFKFENNALSDKTIIVDEIPGALFHNGGRIKFGPDGSLYITTGDSQNPSLAQDKNSLAGKILRIDSEGKNLTVISYGHRNPQGIAWDDKGNLWEVEHGQSATDELNLIEMNRNYGWPIIRGEQAQTGMINPKLQSGNDTWAPAGLAYVKELNALFFAGLRSQTLYEVRLSQTPLVLKEHFKGEFGRIRDVVLGPDNLLYITTSNRDGRGNPGATDDKIIRVNPDKL